MFDWEESCDPIVERMIAGFGACFLCLNLLTLGYGIAVAVLSSGLFGTVLICTALFCAFIPSKDLLEFALKTKLTRDGQLLDGPAFLCLIPWLLLAFLANISFVFAVVSPLYGGLHLIINSPWPLVSNWLLVCGILTFAVCAPAIYWVLRKHIRTIHEEWYKRKGRFKQWCWGRFKCFGSGVLWLSLLMLSCFLIIQYIWMGGGPALMVACATLFLMVFHLIWGLFDMENFRVFVGFCTIVSLILSSIALASGALNPFMNVLALAVLVLSAIPLVQGIICTMLIFSYEGTDKTERKAIGYHIAFLLNLIQSTLFNQSEESQYVDRYWTWDGASKFPSAFECFEPAFVRWFTPSRPNDYTLSKFKRG